VGQKVNPHGFRLGITSEYTSRWYADKGYKDYIKEDVAIRRMLSTGKNEPASAVSIAHARPRQVDIHTARRASSSVAAAPGRPHPWRPRGYGQAGAAEHPRGEEPRDGQWWPGWAAVQAKCLVPSCHAQHPERDEGRRNASGAGQWTARGAEMSRRFYRGPRPLHAAGRHRLRLLRGAPRSADREGVDLQGDIRAPASEARRPLRSASAVRAGGAAPIDDRT
jgi:hypothetical protein